MKRRALFFGKRRWLLGAAVVATSFGGFAFACGSTGGLGAPDASPANDGTTESAAPVDGALPEAGVDAGGDSAKDVGTDAEGDAAEGGPACPGPAGTLDPSFGDGGMVWLKYPGSRASGVAIQTDGKIIVVGATQAGFAVIRLLPTGAFDTDFGTNGVVTTLIGNTGFYSGVAIQGDGKIVATGGVQFLDNRSYDFAVVRYLADGRLDPSFGEAGVATTSFGPGPFQDDYPQSLVLQPDGRILVGGYTETNGVTSTENFALARYNTDGSLDSAFGAGGKVVIDVHTTADAPGVVALLPGGKVVVAGGTAETTSLSARFDVSAVRLNADGTLDTAFADAGVLLTGFGTMSNSPIAAATSDALGRPVLAGRLPNVGGDDFAALRVLASGALDPSFGDGGVVTTDLGSSESSGVVLIQEDGRIVLVGTSAGHLALVRYSSAGMLDPTFGVGGRSLTPPPPGGSLPGSAAALAGCKVVTAGTWSYVEGALNKNAIGIARFHR